MTQLSGDVKAYVHTISYFYIKLSFHGLVLTIINILVRNCVWCDYNGVNILMGIILLAVCAISLACFVTSSGGSWVWFVVASHQCRPIQEGQHPLTGHRAANFRLLANQWVERRLVTQWRHGCRAMRRSVCNAGASNAGRSLCVQISRERSYPCQYIDTIRVTDGQTDGQTDRQTELP